MLTKNLLRNIKNVYINNITKENTYFRTKFNLQQYKNKYNTFYTLDNRFIHTTNKILSLVRSKTMLLTYKKTIP